MDQATALVHYIDILSTLVFSAFPVHHESNQQIRQASHTGRDMIRRLVLERHARLFLPESSVRGYVRNATATANLLAAVAIQVENLVGPFFNHHELGSCANVTLEVSLKLKFEARAREVERALSAVRTPCVRVLLVQNLLETISNFLFGSIGSMAFFVWGLNHHWALV